MVGGKIQQDIVGLESALAGLCATLAAADVVFRKEPQQTILRFQSRSGPLRVQRDDDRITLDFPAQRAHPFQPPAGLQEAIGASPQHCLLVVDLIAVFADETTIRTLDPHPERVARTLQHSWHPDNWGEDGPWMRMFRNARVWVG